MDRKTSAILIGFLFIQLFTSAQSDTLGNTKWKLSVPQLRFQNAPEAVFDKLVIVTPIELCLERRLRPSLEALVTLGYFKKQYEDRCEGCNDAGSGNGGFWGFEAIGGIDQRLSRKAELGPLNFYLILAAGWLYQDISHNYFNSAWGVVSTSSHYIAYGPFLQGAIKIEALINQRVSIELENNLRQGYWSRSGTDTDGQTETLFRNELSQFSGKNLLELRLGYRF